MKNRFSYLFILGLFLSLIACGGSETKETQTTDDSTSQTTETETPKSESAGKEDTCTETKITLTGEGDFKMDNFEVKGLQVYNDLMESDGGKYPALILTMTNYPKEGAYASEPKNDGDVQLIINLSGKSGSNITAQAYDIAGEGFGKSDATVVSFSTKDKMHGLNLPTGKAEITYLSEEKVCGTVDVQSKDGKTSVKGSFSCNLK